MMFIVALLIAVLLIVSCLLLSLFLKTDEITLKIEFFPAGLLWKFQTGWSLISD